jgi:Ca2+-binding EF-hand superfamily protein
MTTPDERSVMTYVSEYYHRFAQQGVKELAARRVNKFLAFAKNINTRKAEYEKRAKTLQEWVAGAGTQLSEYKFGDTLDEAKAAQAHLRNLVVTEEPPMQGEKLDLETLFAEIQTELKVNDRAPYTPPGGLSPEAIEDSMIKLSETERKFGASVRENRFRFIKKEESKLSEEKIAEFKESFQHFDANKNNQLDRTEFKAACTVMNVPVKDEKVFEAVFLKATEGATHVSEDQFIKFMTELLEDKDTPEQVKASFKMMADDKDFITADQMNVPPISQEDVQYLSTAMPQKDSGLDYAAYVDANFVKQTSSNAM